MYLSTSIDIISVDSPIEFVVIGPVRDRLKVLVRSKNAGIDLIGFSQDENEEYLNYTSSLFQTTLIPQKVKSKFAPQVYQSSLIDLDSDQKMRFSVYKFVWRGVKSPRYQHLIEKSFDSKLPDIIESINNQDLERLEWSLAGIISICNSSITRQKKARNQMLFISIVYFAIIVITVLFFILRNFN